jgi:hypothetical protein
VKLFITGDSHVAALKRGYALLAERGELPDDPKVVIRPFGSAVQMRTPFFIEHEDHLEITEPVYRMRVPVLPAKGFPKTDTIYCLAGPLNFSPVWSRPFWRKDWITGMPPGTGRPFSVGMFRSVLLQRVKYQLQLIDKLLQLGERICVIESPGPFRHHPALGHTRPESVIAVHQLCKRLIGQELQGRGVVVVDVPPDGRDELGFMHERFRSENPADVHHANAELGAMMIRRAIQRLAAPVAGSPSAVPAHVR